MRTRTKRWMVAAAALAALFGAAQAQESATVIRASHVCVACHGEGGRSTNPAVPSIAGQTKDYLVAQLKDFRSQVRAEPGRQGYMWGISALLDDATIDGLAAHYAAEKPAAGKPGDATVLSIGKAIFREGLPERKVEACTKCHGEVGQGNGKYPRLAGQNAEYLAVQLDEFGTALRPHAREMRAQIQGLSPSQRRALAAYIQSL
jgi:cytochrome c553